MHGAQTITMQCAWVVWNTCMHVHCASKRFVLCRLLLCGVLWSSSFFFVVWLSLCPLIVFLLRFVLPHVLFVCFLIIFCSSSFFVYLLCLSYFLNLFAHVHVFCIRFCCSFIVLCSSSRLSSVSSAVSSVVELSTADRRVIGSSPILRLPTFVNFC